VLGLPVIDDDDDAAVIALEDAGQEVRFVPAAAGRGEGITEVRLTMDHPMPGLLIAGVRFVPLPLPSAGE
jgi:hypothetical protein